MIAPLPGEVVGKILHGGSTAQGSGESDRRKDKSEHPFGMSIEPMVKTMGYSDVSECWRLDQRCFSDGEAYDRETLRYLLSHNKSFCYKVAASSNEMFAFIIGMIEPDNTGHIVALGVAPNIAAKGMVVN